MHTSMKSGGIQSPSRYNKMLILYYMHQCVICIVQYTLLCIYFIYPMICHCIVVYILLCILYYSYSNVDAQ